MNAQLSKFVESFSKSINDNNAAIFAGAGLSAPAGFVSWKELLREIASDIGLAIDKETDLLAVAQYHFNENGQRRHKLNQKLIEEFTGASKETINHKILATLPIQTYWTTNYDKLIETSLERSGKKCDVKISEPNLTTNLPRRDAIIYKMHGDIQYPDEAVLTKDDYETYNDKRSLFSVALRGDLVSKTFLFLGFSFDDPNLEYVLSRIRVLLGKNVRTHYCFFKRVKKLASQSEEDFQYDKVRQELKARDLMRYGIHALWVDEYDEITQALEAISKRIKRSNIFVSGAANSYEPWKEEVAADFVHKLSYEIASKGHKIISGFGLGIGSWVINGALEFRMSSDYQHQEDSLILRPFPQSNSGSGTIKEKWTRYRKDMLENAGIAVYLFGNKVVDNKLVISNGMLEEFEIATENGVIPIPVGATGYAAEEIWNKVQSNLPKYYPEIKDLLDAIEKLGDKKLTPEELAIQIIKAIGILQKQQ